MGKPTLLWCHGAFSTPEYLQPTVEPLREAGYTNVCPQYPSSGTIPVTPNADQDIALARQHLCDILDVKGQNVILIGHSWGGTVASCAAKGFSQKDREAQGKKTYVQAILFICSFILPAGVSLNGSLPNGQLPPFYDVKEDGKVYVQQAEKWLMQDLTPEQQEKYIPTLQVHSMPSMSTPITYEAFRDIPCGYLVCTEDKALVLPAQEAMIAHVNSQSPPDKPFLYIVERIPASHTPFVSYPKETAAFIRRAAGESV